MRRTPAHAARTALKYVSFPTQTLGKCGKMVPVMVIGSMIDKKSYTLRDYGLALTLTLGCFLFLLTGVRRELYSRRRSGRSR